MLSILIPIYNYDVRKLVQSLSEQVRQLTQEVELVCIDDKSEPSYRALHTGLIALPNVKYIMLDRNIGRAKIRNLLAEEASYDKLLFLDGDSGIVSDQFIETYLQYIEEAVVVGGRQYPSRTDLADGQYLHWKYGTERESRPLAYRQSHPYLYFHSNNFMIDKALLVGQAFDDSISGYGYEDLVLARQLKAKGIQVLHIDNPITHLDIEHRDSFLKKSVTAVQNLRRLNYQGIYLETRLENAANKLKKYKLTGFYKFYFKLRANGITRNLHSDSPKLRNLDHFKLYNYLMA